MINTIAGSIIGGIASYYLCKFANIDTKPNHQRIIILPSTGQILIFLGIIFGAGIGFGVGSYKLFKKY